MVIRWIEVVHLSPPEEAFSWERLYLDVPFAEKDLARTRGAAWDPEASAWYIAGGKDQRPFAQWLPAQVSPDDPFVQVLGIPVECWRCTEQTIAVGACQDGDQLVFANDGVLQVIASQLTAEELAELGAGPLRPRFSEAIGQSSWTNACVACEAVLSVSPLRESLNAFTAQGQEELPVLGRFQVPVDLLRRRV